MTAGRERLSLSIVAIDPGSERSALLELRDGRAIVEALYDTNEAVLERVHAYQFERGTVRVLVCEQIASYGMPVGAEVFTTVFWTGRFCEASAVPFALVPRRAVKLHLCGSARANDATIRQALIDRYGPGKDTAIGTKRAPGPLYGLTGDLWAALALAVTYHDTHGGTDGADATRSSAPLDVRL